MIPRHGGFSSSIFQDIVNRSDAKHSKLFCDYLRSSEFQDIVVSRKPWIVNQNGGWHPSALSAADDWISNLIKKAKFDKHILAEAPAVAEVMPKTYTEKTRILNGGTKVEFFEEPKWYDSGLELPEAGKSYRRAELDELGNLYVELNGDGDQFLIKQLNTQGKILSIVDQDGNTETYLAKEIPRSGAVKEMSRSTSGEIILHQQNGKKYLLGHDQHGPAMTMDSPKCEQFFINLYQHTGR